MLSTAVRKARLALAKFVFRVKIVGRVPEGKVIVVSHRRSPYDHLFLDIAFGYLPFRLHEESPPASSDFAEHLRVGGVLGFMAADGRLRNRPPNGAPGEAVAEVALKNGCRLLPVAVEGSNAIRPGRWPRLYKVTVRIGEAVDVSEYAGRPQVLGRHLLWEIRKLETRLKRAS